METLWPRVRQHTTSLSELGANKYPNSAHPVSSHLPLTFCAIFSVAVSPTNMPERRPRRIKQRAEASPPAEAGGTDTRPESATAATARPRGRPAAKVRKLAATPDVDGHAGEDAPKSKQIGRATRRRGKLHQMLDMPLDIIMEVSSLILVLRSVPHLTLARADMRESSTQRYSLLIQTVEDVLRVLHSSGCAFHVEIGCAQRSRPPAVPR